MNRLFFGFIIITCALISAWPQTTPKHKGIELYEQGKYTEAAKLLEAAGKKNEYKSNAEIWNYLGLSYTYGGQHKKGIKAFSKAIKFAPQNSVYRANLAYCYLLNRQPGKVRSVANEALNFDPNNLQAYYLRGSANLWEAQLDSAETDALKIIEVDPSFAPAYRLQSDVIIEKLAQKVTAGAAIWDEVGYFRQAAELLEVGVRNTAGKNGNAALKEELSAIAAFRDHFSKPRPQPPYLPAEPEPGETPYKMLSMPKAVYTEAARKAGTQGSVRVVMILGANGRIQRYLLLKRLGNGLDAQVSAAVKQIKFEPKKIDGKPVRAVAIRDYTFSIY